MSTLRVALAQLNPHVGDLRANRERLVVAAHEALAQGANLLVTSELALTGYPPEDLLFRPDFARATTAAIKALAARLPRELSVIVGTPRWEGGRCYNAAAWIEDGQIVAWYDKERLPNYSVFDEVRYFTPGSRPCVRQVAGVPVAVMICEDIWHDGPVQAARAEGAELVVVLNASPYHSNKHVERQAVVAARALRAEAGVLYVNQVGGQDELVFDGASFALHRDGTLAWRAPAFRETVATLTWQEGAWTQVPESAVPLCPEAELFEALVTGVRDYLVKNGFPGAIIGLSGGIDSALTTCIAAEALGPQRVRTVMMPSPYTAAMSLEDAAHLAQTLGVSYEVIEIQPAMQALAAMLAPSFAGRAADTTEENIQARIRGTLLMALSNKFGYLVLTTGNKSEMAAGYSTLYGDMAGGFSVLKDVYKTQVYRLAHWLNREREVIPRRIIERPPSAELRPNQTDQDSLPPYEVLDAVIELFMEQEKSPSEIVAMGYAPEHVQRAVTLLVRNEYKRRQAPLGVRVSRRAFGKDWRYPITADYRFLWQEELQDEKDRSGDQALQAR